MIGSLTEKEALVRWKSSYCFEMTQTRRPKLSWGDWTLNRSTYELVYKKCIYHVDLDRCCTSAQVLDWIQHITGKTFAHKDPRCIFDLVCALKDLLELPVGYCTWGNMSDEIVDIRSRVDQIDERKKELRNFLDKISVNNPFYQKA